MSAAPAYSYYEQPRRHSNRGLRAHAQAGSAARVQAAPNPHLQPDIGVIPGRGTQTRTVSSSLVFLAKTLAVVFIFMALLGCARITLSSAAVSTALESRDLSSQIDAARSEGSKLEVAQSSLSNPTRIKDAATALGMYAPAYVANIDISGDVVVLDAEGSLSLSGSAAMLAQG